MHTNKKYDFLIHIIYAVHKRIHKHLLHEALQHQRRCANIHVHDTGTSKDIGIDQTEYWHRSKFVKRVDVHSWRNQAT